MGEVRGKEEGSEGKRGGGRDKDRMKRGLGGIRGKKEEEEDEE